ncbi:MAG: YdeI/OmpD-associated family protein [Ferruginibacter sp.]|nr:YdeI/OmpD-associated family protein [Ferruginibacter sp.]
MNPKVDHYLIAGCGRCNLYNTPQCKVNNWQKELVALRMIMLECGLTEELKWSMPTYTADGKNVLIVAAFKDFCSINFFKGALLKDEQHILVQPGENSQSAKLLKFTDVKQITKQKVIIKSYVKEAIEIEKQGKKVSFKKITEQKIPEELQTKFDELPAFKAAFNALTPGKQRGYLIHFSQPKQSATRQSRIEKCIPKIFEGKGFNDYK